MNAKELFRKELNPADCWSEQTISFDFNDVTEFAERYLEHKLKLLGIGGVVKSFTAKQVADMLFKDFSTVEQAIHYFDNLK